MNLSTIGVTPLSFATCIVALITCIFNINLASDSSSGGYFLVFILYAGLIWLVVKCNYKEAWFSIVTSCILSFFFSFTLDFGEGFIFLLSVFLIELIPAIIAFFKTINRAAKAAEDLIVWAVNGVVDLLTLTSTVRQKCPDALRMIILERRHRSIDVGIFNSNHVSQKPDEIICIKSTDGISPDLQPGIIYSLS